VVGRSFPRKVVLVMAIFSILTAFLYLGVVQFIKFGMSPKELNLSWRGVWLIFGAFFLFGLTPFGFFTITEPRVSSDPESQPTDTSAQDGNVSRLAGPDPERTLWEAMRSPVFILFGLSCLVTGTANAGIALFNESLLKDRGFSRDVFFDSVTIGIFGVILFKLVGAELCQRWSMRMMCGLCMLLYASTALAVPYLQTVDQVYIWSIAKALALSVHTVIYYAIWGYAFGRRHLAQIQGAAHVLTVTASGLGPVIFGLCRDNLGTYDPCLYATAFTSLAIAAGMFCFRVPCAERPREDTVNG
jgi:hypothetical protein